MIGVTMSSIQSIDRTIARDKDSMSHGASSIRSKSQDLSTRPEVYKKQAGWQLCPEGEEI